MTGTLPNTMTGTLPNTWRTVLRLASADLWTEWVLALCMVLALSAVMAPLIVLAGLRAGVIEGLRQTLLEDPHAREIQTVANRRFDTALLNAIAKRPDVAFLVPKTRTLAATLLVEPPGQPANAVRLELIPTAPHDPLLPAAVTKPAGPPNLAIVLSAAAAARLHASVGQPLSGRLGRLIGGERQSIALPLTVAAIAPPSAFGRDGAFVTLDLAVFVENYQEGDIGPPADPADIRPAPQRDFPGFRLYARRLEDLPALDAFLRGQDIDIVSRAGDVAGLLQIDRSLGLLFSMVAGLGGVGFLVSLGAGLWANVDRKRMPLALLRFLGLSAAALSLFPLAQACLLAALGAAAAVTGALLAEQAINGMFAGTLAFGRPLCAISPVLASAAAVIAIAGAAIVATAAGWRAAKVEPWEGVMPP